MIYIQITAAEKDVANQWVRDNVDHSGDDTFVVNKQDDLGNEYCLISLPDNGSDYNNKMIEHFGVWDRIEAPVNGHNAIKLVDDADNQIRLTDVIT